jgi:hypothetical protein
MITASKRRRNLRSLPSEGIVGRTTGAIPLDDSALQPDAGWRDDVWCNMRALLAAPTGAARRRIISRMDQKATTTGAEIAARAETNPRRVRLLSHGLRQPHTAAIVLGLARRQMTGLALAA